jgi:hypothetical protein
LELITIVVVDDDEVHVFPHFRTVVAQMIISATYLTPWISFYSSCGGVMLNGLMILLRVGSFLYLLHHEVHFCRDHVHLMNGVHTTFLWLEALLIPSLVGNHLFNEVLGILELEKCSSSSTSR